MKCPCLSFPEVVLKITANNKNLTTAGQVFESKLSMFSKNYFPLPQSTYFVIAPHAPFCYDFKRFDDRVQYYNVCIDTENGAPAVRE